MANLLDKYKNYITFFILLFFLIGLKTLNPSFVKAISFLSFDLYQKTFPLKKGSSEVVIIDIDEKSLEKFGQFPWNRSIFAKIIENVNSTPVKRNTTYSNFTRYRRKPDDDSRRLPVAQSTS